MVAPKFDPNGAISPGGFPTTSSSGGRVRSAGNGKSGIPGLIPVQESELARAWDPATRRELRDAWKDDAADQLFGPTIKAANKPDMSVSFKPDLSDAMEGFKAIEDETHASFKRGFMTVLQGGDVWDLLAQRLEETAAEGLADTMMSLIKLISGGDATGGAGAASWLVKGASWLFGGGRMAGGGQAWPGTMASTGEYGDELAIFGKGASRHPRRDGRHAAASHEGRRRGRRERQSRRCQHVDRRAGRGAARGRRAAWPDAPHAGRASGRDRSNRE